MRYLDDSQKNKQNFLNKKSLSLYTIQVEKKMTHQNTHPCARAG